ncbi:hypothetical protein [Vibrio taketomensis]|uniref:hypothetical protein n=1 Tax=Vibrio taketomensis TaxID=2572923 RepID=UPI0022B2A2E6|nr:hypothetical protein [Vibrio taketomensis]
MNNGLARTTDLFDSEARYLQAQARQIEIGNELRDSLQALYELTGTVPQSLATVGDELDLVTPEPQQLDIWVDNAQQNNPYLRNKVR